LTAWAPFGNAVDMGVEMRIFLVPRDNAFRPDGAALASFVEKLRAGQWIADPTTPVFGELRFRMTRTSVHAAKTGAYLSKAASSIARLRDGAGITPLPGDERGLANLLASERDSDFILVWPVENLGERLRYPLDQDSPAADPDETYFDFEMWLARDYVHVTSEQVQPFDDDDTRCSCGAALAYDPEGVDENLFFASRLMAACKQCGKAFDVSTRIATVRDAWTNAESKVAGGATFRFAVVVDCGKCWPEGGEFHVHPDLRRLTEAHFGRPFYEIVQVY
jgi:hypothetical protein